MPAVRGHQPDLVIVSAGFDAHRADPLCGLHLSSSTFGVMASELAGIGAGRVFVLEGGYDLTALEESVKSVLVATG